MKDALEKSYTTFKRNLSALTKAIERESSSARNLKVKLDSLTEALDSLDAAHTMWKSKADLTEDQLAQETFSDDWLQERWDEADIQIDLANDKIHYASEAARKPEVTTELLILQERLHSLQVSIKSKIDAVSKELEVDDLSKLPVLAFTEMLAEAESQLQDTHRDLSKAILSLMSDNIPEAVASHEQFHRNHEQRILQLQVILAKYTQEPSAEGKKESAPTRSRVEIEKCKVPTFSGKTIDYPEFKKSWQKVAGAYWDDDSQLEQMKFKVDNHTKMILTRCNDMNEVWDALDKEYGQEQEVVNAVNHELRRLRSEPCSTSQFIVNLRNSLPNLEEALMAVNGLEHLKTPDKVDFLVEKFDERTQHEWEYFRSKQDGKTYDRFFAFLLDRYDSCRSTVARAASKESNPPSMPVDGGTINGIDINNCIKFSFRWTTNWSLS